MKTTLSGSEEPSPGPRALCLCVDVGHACRARPPVCRRPAGFGVSERREDIPVSAGDGWVPVQWRIFGAPCGAVPASASLRTRRTRTKSCGRSRRARTRGDRSAGALGPRRSEARRAMSPTLSGTDPVDAPTPRLASRTTSRQSASRSTSAGIPPPCAPAGARSRGQSPFGRSIVPGEAVGDPRASNGRLLSPTGAARHSPIG
jgi:hypothetical protein